MLYTLMGLTLMTGAVSPLETVETIEAMHLEKSMCEARAVFVAESMGASRCRPELELDPKTPYKNSNTVIQLPSGRVVELYFTRGYWFYPNDLEGDDLKLVEDWTKFVYSK